MNQLSVARVIARLLLVCTLVGSGGYVLVYLYRWEWNRALISGIFFLAAEVALLADNLSSRLRAMEEQHAAARARDDARTGVAVEAIAASRPVPPDRFHWLRPTGTQMGVFVPVLMGAGVLLSALAWAVERLARATARPVLEERLARRLAGLTFLPAEGGFLPQPARAAASVPHEFQPRRR